MSPGLGIAVTHLIPAVGLPALGTLPELGATFQSLKFAITCLYKMPVRNVTPNSRLDRFKRGIYDDTSLYQHFDTLYVRDLFSTSDVQVATRLGRLITRRRQLLRYREVHNEDLQRESKESSAAQLVPSIGATEPATAPVLKDISLSGTKSYAASSIARTSVKASTFDPKNAPKLQIDLLMSATVSEPDTVSSVATTRTGRELLPIPSRPTNTEGDILEDFECPYCCLTVHIRPSAHAWK